MSRRPPVTGCLCRRGRAPESAPPGPARRCTYDGKIREVERHGPSVSAAKARLREAIRDRHKAETDAEITSDTKLVDVVRIWLVDLRAEVAAGEKSPGAREVYETSAHRIIEGMGSLRVREATVGRIDRFLAATATNHRPMSAKRAKTVLTGVLGLAARHDAIKTSPVRDTTRIKYGQKSTATALDLPQVYDLRVKLAADQKARDWDLLDFVDMMLATGKRIGETCAITWDSLDLSAGTVEIEVRRARGRRRALVGWRRVTASRFQILLLDGGGLRGMFSAAVLARLGRKTSTCGSSTTST